MRVPTGFGDNNTTVYADGLTDRQRGEKFFQDYVSEGFYTAGSGDDLIAAMDSVRGSYIEGLGAQARVGQMSDSDLAAVRQAVYSATKPNFYTGATDIVPDPGSIDAAMAAQPGSLSSVLSATVDKTADDIVTTAKVVGSVAAVGGSLYLLYLGAAAVGAYMVFFHGSSAAPRAQNPRRKRRRPTTASRRRLEK